MDSVTTLTFVASRSAVLRPVVTGPILHPSWDNLSASRSVTSGPVESCRFVELSSHCLLVLTLLCHSAISYQCLDYFALSDMNLLLFVHWNLLNDCFSSSH